MFSLKSVNQVIKSSKCILQFKNIRYFSSHINNQEDNQENNQENKNISINNGKGIFYNQLLKNNVDTVFGISGGSVMPLIDAFYESKNIKLIINADEQCLGHSVTGYSKTSDKVGVGVVTSGPGITNALTPILDATNDSTPIVIFSGQVPLSAAGTNAFQEAPAVELTKHITKWSYQIDDINDMEFIINKAFQVAKDGKPGAVHIDIPKCISYQPFNVEETNLFLHNQKMYNKIMPSLTYNKKYNHSSKILGFYKGSDNNLNNNDNENNDKKSNNIIFEDDDFDYKELSNLINKASKPILYVGQGCNADYEELRKLAIYGNIPVTTTIHAAGVFDETKCHSLRWCGMHGLPAANYALQESDLIIAIGSRFDDRTTGNLEKYAPNAKKASILKKGGIIHCNINSEELDSVVKSDYNFCMTSGEFIKKLLPFIRVSEREVWFSYIDYLKRKLPFEMKSDKHKIHIEDVLSRINTKTINKDVIFTTGVGNHQMQTYQFIESQKPGKIISSGSLGVMGAGLPYAIGAQIANADKMIVCVDGDGSFNMTLNDLKTVAEYNLPIKIAIMNNNAQMMVTVWEKLFFEKRYTATIPDKNPNYIALAESFGIKAHKCFNAYDLDKKLDYFINYKEGPILMEFNIERDMCLPLVKPGCALDDMILPDDDEFVELDRGLVPS